MSLTQALTLNDEPRSNLLSCFKSEGAPVIEIRITRLCRQHAAADRCEVSCHCINGWDSAVAGGRISQSFL